jgi:3-phenylpropionate/trans-cinnamate dioxygenase ferredoxin reductase component
VDGDVRSVSGPLRDRGEPLDLDGAVTVVGASLAGLRAAQGLRKGGHRGPLVLVGAESHLPYDRPPLSKQVLAGKWASEKTGLAGAEALDALGIDVRLGRRATGLDAAARRVELDDGSVLDADAVVIATGATPRRLFADEGVLVLRTLDDCAALRSAVVAGGEGCRVVVIGAGFIGSEVAATCAGLDCVVTVIETLPVPLAPALGETVGGALGALHGRNGVTLRTETSVVSLERGPSGTSVELTDGTVVVADVVMAGIGVVPEVRWLAGSGLTLENGVVCDESLFAADGVVAAGDIARWPYRGEPVRIEHWQMASDMGDAAGAALLAGRSGAPAFVPVPYFWSDQYGEKIQMLGRPASGDEVVVVDGALTERFVALYRRGNSLSAVAALTRPRQLMSFRPLLAAGASFDEALVVAEALH